MIGFRLEEFDSYHGKTVGIFSGYALAKACYELSMKDINYVDPYKHPAPHRDEKLKECFNNLSYAEKTEYYFGFLNIDHYNMWFDKNILEALEKDVRLSLAIYEVNEKYTIEGSVQCVFKMEHAKLIKRNRILDINLCMTE